MVVAYKISNEQEWFACQEYLFKQEYYWQDGTCLIIENPLLRYPIFIINDYSLKYSINNYWNFRCINFTIILREYKLKRILKNEK